ncbi:hypothetical protein EV360DRAFT_46599 [Lentinula raphanica]|nr:hypothetical protein EV360DRAFT_46599 [Lentinula raphanica]
MNRLRSVLSVSPWRSDRVSQLLFSSKKSDAKSDAKRSQYPILSPLHTSIPPPSPSENPQLLPELPSEDDFLILPDLTRRFSLLRNSSGEPLPVDLLRSRLAEQRARGVENHISEEEEDMILESLGLRNKYATPSDKSENSIRQSTRSSLTHSPSTGRSNKRYSNNLFGSGRLRDYSYVRSATSPSKHTSSRATSAAPSEVSTSSSAFDVSHEFKSGTPENDVLNSKQAVRSAPLIPPAPYGQHNALVTAEYRLSKSLGPSALKRASLALEEVIRELEEDAEDEIVMFRSTPISRSDNESRSTVRYLTTCDNPLTDSHQAGMAISSDHHVQTETEDKRMSPIPSHILPGYIPGMPRPMTPREDTDNDMLRSHSITPRAAAVPSPHGPNIFSSALPIAPSPPPTIPEHAVTTSPFSAKSSRPLSPPFLQRSPVDPTQRGERGAELIDFDSSAVPGRKRPASPLSGLTYQPLTAAAVSTSRPSTPSNVTWTIPASKSSPQNIISHNRNGSWFSDGEGSTDPHGTNGHSKSASASRSLRSPALPDSPILERSHPHAAYSSGAYPYDNRPPSTISGFDLNGRPIRSPTPTQSPTRSPISPTFPSMDSSPRPSRRASKQNGTSVPFTLNSFNPVLFSPLANSSRSSLESTGSSYHSWEADNKFLFVDADSQSPPWHDLSFSSQSTSTTPAGSPDTEWNPEDVIGNYAGLHKSDFAAIQETLVNAVASKNSTVSEARERVPSLRRRRPSTSQSNYSLNFRMTTPPPQQLQPLEGSATMNSDQILKASALLNSVLDSINTQIKDAPRDTSPPAVTDNPTTAQEISPTTRRNRDLAQVLFGEDTPEEEAPSARAPRPEDASLQMDLSKDKDPVATSPLNVITSSPETSAIGVSSPSRSALHNPLRSPSTPHIPQTPEAQAELAREIQRKTDAAMLALRKRPSNSNLSKEGLVSSGTVRKKLNTKEISTPTLLSASTSVDTIPLRTPPLSSSGPPSKIASRFRKLRGTLRKGNIPIEEIKVTPYPLDLESNPPPHSSQPQFARYDSSKLHPMDSAVSATEIGRFRVPAVPVPSPPASAGPGLKGFMARFRGKARTTESVEYKGRQYHTSPYQMSPVQTPLSLASQPLVEEVNTPRGLTTQTAQHPPSSSSSSSSPQNPSVPRLQTPHSDEQMNGVNQYESQALKQLFNAASDLGLDQNKLSELLVRSGSISSRSTDWTMLTRNNSSATKSRPENRDERQFQSPTPQSEWSTFEDSGHRVSKMPVSRKSSLKQPENVGIRRPRQRGADDTNTIIRRTIIYPEDRGVSVADLNALGRKNSSRHRRASALSITSSNRSIHERVPTPPPPRSPTGRRFSADESPPVPQLPQSWAARMDKSLAAPSASGPSNTPYDSVYDMYSGEKSSQSAPAEAGTSDPGPALEVIELANGETIWSIVNGLRDDDVESLYTGRTSFQSDYDNDEGVQVFVKDHTRTGSKGSTSSYVSRRKIVQGKNRPETKVYYTSSAQIGRLIENLSQGMDAGTFNFSQGQADNSHSATSSMTGHTNSEYLTVEERLEHMLGAMKAAQ